MRFAAKNWGTWGSSLSLRLEFVIGRRFRPVVDVLDPPAEPGERDMPLATGAADIPPGTLLRVRGAGLDVLGEFRWVEKVERRVTRLGRRRPTAILDRPLPGDLDDATAPVVEVITATLRVGDGDRLFPRWEQFAQLGLRRNHPRFVGDVVRDESLLMEPEGPWIDAPLSPPGPLLPAVGSRRTQEGRDRYAELTGDAFFDGRPGDPPDDDPLGERPHHGVDRLAREAEVGLMVVPDLFWSWVVPGPAPASWADEPYDPCAPPVIMSYDRPNPRAELLDGRDPAELALIVERQRRVVALAERHRRFTALLDVPPGLDARGIARWRTEFDSAYAAAYHPWLAVTGSAGERVQVPASAFAAGIIADRERRLGLPCGPANELARGAVLAADRVSDAEHDALFELGIIPTSSCDADPSTRRTAHPLTRCASTSTSSRIARLCLSAQRR